MGNEEKERIKSQRDQLGDDGLKAKATKLAEAIEFNEKPIPKELIKAVKLIFIFLTLYLILLI
jgi:hypothetical protein